MLDLSFAPHSVNAADFGFLPENSADENSAALQAIVNRGGDIVIDVPGVYDLSETIRLGDDVSLRFGAGVYVRRALSADGTQHQGYVFVNKGAYERKYNQNISITGLHLIASGMEPSYENQTESDMVTGLRAHLAFFYVRNLTIRDFELLDLGRCAFGIQICTFENAILENVHIEGGKDAVHFGKGSKFVVRHGLFRTFDDPIALNAHDYATSNPQLGWIEDGLTDVLRESGTGAIVFSPLAGGRLTGKYQHGIPADSRAGHDPRYLKPSMIDERLCRQTAALGEIAAARGQTTAQLALQWVLRDEVVTSALIGASRPEQVLENIAALSFPALTQEELAEIDAALAL